MSALRRINWVGNAARSLKTKVSNTVEPGKIPAHKGNKDDDLPLNHYSGHKMFGIEPLTKVPPKQHAGIQRAYTKKPK